MSRGDTLTDSTKRLVEHTAALKKKGYKQVVLAGQSFGAFLALMAADASPQVDAVIATAPAAYGNFDEFYDSWRLNATKLYPLLEQVQHARVMVFYFHGDNFDPGGRGDRSREILAERGLGHVVVDQPAYLTTHWAASSGLFLRRFGDCIRDFANDDALKGEMVCTPRWGTMPSAELKLPPDMLEPRAPRSSPAGRHDDRHGRCAAECEGLGRVPRRLVRLLPERARGAARGRIDTRRSTDRHLFDRSQHRQSA